MKIIDGENYFTEAEFKSGRRAYDRDLLKSIDELRGAITQLNLNMAASNQRQEYAADFQKKHDLTLYGPGGLCTLATKQEMINQKLIEADTLEIDAIEKLKSKLSGLTIKTATISGGVSVAAFFIGAWIKEIFKRP